MYGTTGKDQTGLATLSLPTATAYSSHFIREFSDSELILKACRSMTDALALAMESELGEP